MKSDIAKLFYLNIFPDLNIYISIFFVFILKQFKRVIFIDLDRTVFVTKCVPIVFII